MKRVILHAGPSKTGTTTIQALLTEHASLLLQHGVYYPATSPPSNEGHPSLALEARTASGQFVPPTTMAECSWDEAINNFEASGANSLLLSSEDFSDLDTKHWEWIGDKLKSFEISVILAIRNPADVVFSAWKQSVKSGFGAGEEVLDFESAADLLASLPRISVFRLVDCIETVLKPSKISLFTINSRMSSIDLYQRFVLAADLPDIVVHSHNWSVAESRNRALSDWKTMILLQLNQELLSKSPEEMIFPGNIDTRRLQVRSYILEALEDMPDTTRFEITISPTAITKLSGLQSNIIEWASNRELIGSLSDISDSTRLEKSAGSATDINPVKPSSVDVTNLLYKTVRNQVHVRTTLLNRANAYGSSQSVQVIKLAAVNRGLEERYADLYSTLELANEFGATQSNNVLRLKNIIYGMERKIADLARTLNTANEYGSNQSTNVSNLISALADKDREIVELRKKLGGDV